MATVPAFTPFPRILSTRFRCPVASTYYVASSMPETPPPPPPPLSNNNYICGSRTFIYGPPLYKNSLMKVTTNSYSSNIPPKSRSGIRLYLAEPHLKITGLLSTAPFLKCVQPVAAADATFLNSWLIVVFISLFTSPLHLVPHPD